MLYKVKHMGCQTNRQHHADRQSRGKSMTEKQLLKGRGKSITEKELANLKGSAMLTGKVKASEYLG